MTFNGIEFIEKKRDGLRHTREELQTFIDTVMRGEIDLFDRPAFAVGKVFGLQPRKKGAYAGGGFFVVRVFDIRAEARRVCRHVVFQGNR